MPTLLDFRRRIRSVKNTQQITRAMKFVAAAKLRRAQERVFAARPYAGETLSLLRSAVARIEHPAHPLLARRAEEKVLLLVVTGDKGLCGAFNTNVIRRAQEFLREHAGRGLEVIPVGKKGRDALRKRKVSVTAEYINISTRVEYAQAREVAGRVMEMFTTGQTDAVYAVYNEFKTVLTQRLLVEKILPIDPQVFEPAPAERAAAGGHGTEAIVDYLYEQPPAEVFDRLLPHHVETQVFRVLLESAAAEHAARMTAMDSATNNASELIDQLTLRMNKARQASITKEIIEVVSGAASATS